MPETIAAEVTFLSDVFQRLTETKEHAIWFPNAPAPKFHIDGAATVRPAWRLTCAFNGPQTQWHKYQRNENTPVISQGFVGFPMIPEAEIGELDTDYFSSEGPLMFLTHSHNGLFHRTPPETDEKRFMVTMDASAPRRENCTASCPFPCRTP